MTKDNWIKASRRHRGVVVPLKSTPGSIPEAPLQQACKRCGKPYPVQGIMVCPCHPMFSPNYEPEPPIEFKTEKDCQRFIDWMYANEVERKIELKDAEERGYQLGLRDGIKKEHENSGAWTDLNKQGVINTHKLIKDAIEKTNKRWREELLAWYPVSRKKSVPWHDEQNKYRRRLVKNIKRVSDLLEDKESA